MRKLLLWNAENVVVLNYSCLRHLRSFSYGGKAGLPIRKSTFKRLKKKKTTQIENITLAQLISSVYKKIVERAKSVNNTYEICVQHHHHILIALA